MSSDKLERLLLRRRRQEAMEGLRLISSDSSEQDASAVIKPLSAVGLRRSETAPQQPRAAKSVRASFVASPDPTPVPPPEDEPWLLPPRTQLNPPQKKRRRRFSHPVLKVLKRGLSRVIDTLIVLVLILFIGVLGLYLYDNFLYPRLSGATQPAVQAQGTSPLWSGQGYLSSDEEAMPQAPLPFVAYSTTVDVESAFVPVPTPAPGTVRPDRLVIPRIQLDTPVVEVTIEGGVWQVAEYAAGYHRGTARPGTIGNTVIAGHKGLKGAVFLRLDDLNPGDEVFLHAGPRLYRYVVSEKESVWPYQVEVMAQTSEPVLTLITCTTYDTQRLIVVAEFDREITGGVDAQP